MGASDTLRRETDRVILDRLEDLETEQDQETDTATRNAPNAETRRVSDLVRSATGRSHQRGSRELRVLFGCKQTGRTRVFLNGRLARRKSRSKIETDEVS